jgi:putative transposase
LTRIGLWRRLLDRLPRTWRRACGDTPKSSEWALKFGREYASCLHRRAPRRRDKRHLNEIVISIVGKKHWLWRAVDREGFVLDVLVQSRQDKKPAKRLLRKLLKK